jgi:hypothetical protein
MNFRPWRWQGKQRPSIRICTNPPARKTGTQRLSLCLKIVAGAAALYLGLCLNMLSYQERFIFPGHATQGWPTEMVKPSSDFDMVHLKTADGDPFVALFGVALDHANRPVADARSQPTILFFNGNAMCLANSLNIFREFRSLGANVMIAEYPGYGMSGGKASEKSFYAAADAAYEHLRQRPDVDANRIVAAGWSIGAAVAIVECTPKSPSTGEPEQLVPAPALLPPLLHRGIRLRAHGALGFGPARP